MPSKIYRPSRESALAHLNFTKVELPNSEKISVLELVNEIDFVVRNGELSMGVQFDSPLGAVLYYQELKSLDAKDSVFKRDVFLRDDRKAVFITVNNWSDNLVKD